MARASKKAAEKKAAEKIEAPTTSFRVGVPHLKSELDFAIRCLESKSKIPALLNLFFQVDGGQLTIYCTDLDRWAMTRFPIQSKGEAAYSFGANAEKLKGIINLAEEAEIEFAFEEEGSRVRVFAGSSKFALPTIGKDFYPESPKATLKLGSLPGQMMRSICNLPRFSASEKDPRAYKNLQLTAADGKITANATTGNHLVQYQGPCENLAIETCLIPSKDLALIQQLCNGEPVSIWQVDFPNKLMFRCKDRQIITTLDPDKFADVSRLFSSARPTQLVATASLLQSKVRIASPSFDEQTQTLHILFSPKGLTFRGHNTIDHIEADVTLPASDDSSNKLIIHCDRQAIIQCRGSYLGDILSLCDEKDVEMKFDLEADGWVISAIEMQPTEPDANGGTHRYVLMPMKPKDEERKGAQ